MSNRPRESTLTETRSDQKLQRPRMWRVLLHNDDYTTLDFVVFVLETIFQKPHAEAFAVMMNGRTFAFSRCGSKTMRQFSFVFPATSS